jgi:hypothetical protein
MQARRGLTHYRLVQAAVGLEAARLENGRYPRDVEAARLPVDPFAPGSTLRFAPDAGAVRIWSVGFDGRDDNGRATSNADLVLARE